MFVKVNKKMRKVVGLSTQNIRQTANTIVFDNESITTNNIKYIKIFNDENGDIDVIEMTETEKGFIDEEQQRYRDYTLSNAKIKSKKRLNDLFQKITDKVAFYPVNEMISWEAQLKEAKAYLADNTVETPLIDGIASERIDLGSTLADRKSVLIANIIANNDNWIKTGILMGYRHIIEKQINDATAMFDLPDMEEVEKKFNEKLITAFS